MNLFLFYYFQFKRTAQLYGLLPMSDDYFYGYDSTVYPSVPNEFSTAAFRFGHTLIM